MNRRNDDLLLLCHVLPPLPPVVAALGRPNLDLDAGLLSQLVGKRPVNVKVSYRFLHFQFECCFCDFAVAQLTIEAQLLYMF